MFEEADAPVMEPLDGVNVTMAKGYDFVVANIKAATKRRLPQLQDMPEFREQVPIAIVGGGPSLNKTYAALKTYKHVMVCGSAHDHLIGLGVAPTYCVISDPDPVMAKYFSGAFSGCRYLVASYCHSDVFDMLEGQNVTIWNPAGGDIDFESLGAGGLAIGGGCTVATRAISVALCFGFQHIHLFGMDTCIESPEVHHAYAYQTPDEALGPTRRIQLEKDGPMFLVPDYLVAQLYDFKFLIETYKGKLELRVAGGGLIDELLKVARKTRKVVSDG